MTSRPGCNGEGTGASPLRCSLAAELRRQNIAISKVLVVVALELLHPEGSSGGEVSARSHGSAWGGGEAAPCGEDNTRNDGTLGTRADGVPPRSPLGYGLDTPCP